jgi:hypothetical protein
LRIFLTDAARLISCRSCSKARKQRRSNSPTVAQALRDFAWTGTITKQRHSSISGLAGTGNNFLLQLEHEQRRSKFHGQRTPSLRICVGQAQYETALGKICGLTWPSPKRAAVPATQTRNSAAQNPAVEPHPCANLRVEQAQSQQRSEIFWTRPGNTAVQLLKRNAAPLKFPASASRAARLLRGTGTITKQRHLKYFLTDAARPGNDFLLPTQKAKQRQIRYIQRSPALRDFCVGQAQSRRPFKYFGPDLVG